MEERNHQIKIREDTFFYINLQPLIHLSPPNKMYDLFRKARRQALKDSHNAGVCAASEQRIADEINKDAGESGLRAAAVYMTIPHAQHTMASDVFINLTRTKPLARHVSDDIPPSVSVLKALYRTVVLANDTSTGYFSVSVCTDDMRVLEDPRHDEDDRRILELMLMPISLQWARSSSKSRAPRT